jgi:hypothetical protein
MSFNIMSFHRRFALSLALFLLGGACLPLTANTIGYYQFEDSPGVLKDSSAAQRDLTQVGTAGVQVASTFGSVPNPPAGSATNAEAMSFNIDRGFTAEDISYSALTVEAFINLTSVNSASQARVIAAQFGGTTPTRAFNFGVAGNGSGAFGDDRTLFLQVNTVSDVIQNIDSTFRLTLGVDYFVAVSIDPGSLNAGADGTVTFYLKDLTNGGELQTVSATATGLSAFVDANNVITIGSAGTGAGSRWDGVIDEVRLSDAVLGGDQLLIAVVPEPTTCALVLGGLMLAGVLRRHRRTAR